MEVHMLSLCYKGRYDPEDIGHDMFTSELMYSLKYRAQRCQRGSESTICLGYERCVCALGTPCDLTAYSTCMWCMCQCC
jgi:hypothetical protein